MPRIQTFVSNKVLEDIDALISERRQEGAADSELTMSSITSMLIELGLRVYRLQREKEESGFNQIEFNKQIFENVLRTRAMCTEIMRMCVLSEEVTKSERFNLDVMKQSIAGFTQKHMDVFFLTEEQDTEN